MQFVLHHTESCNINVPLSGNSGTPPDTQSLSTYHAMHKLSLHMHDLCVKIFTIFIAALNKFACVWHCAVQATSKAKQLWAPTISPIWWKSEDMSANKATNSLRWASCSPPPCLTLSSPSLRSTSHQPGSCTSHNGPIVRGEVTP